jgi:polyphosphate kinase 2 (PPK2 family)
LEQPEDQWKFSTGDLKERERWDDYMHYYEEAINKTITDYAPWYIVPADDKGIARYIIAKTIWQKLNSLSDITEPQLDQKVKDNIQLYKDQLKG